MTLIMRNGIIKSAENHAKDIQAEQARTIEFLQQRIKRLEQALNEIAAVGGSDKRCTLSHSWLARAALNAAEKESNK